MVVSRRLKHRIFLGVAAFVLLSLGILGILPSVVGSKWVYEPILARLKERKFHVSIESIHLSWWTPLTIQGVRMSQDEQSDLLTIEQIRSNRGLLGYLIGGRDLGRIEIVNPVVAVELLEDTSNLQKFVDAVQGDDPRPETAPKAKPTIDLEVVILGAEATVRKNGNERPLAVVPKFDVNLAYRALDGDTRLEVQPTTILDHVELTPELIRLGLAYGIPLLANSAWFDGKISLNIGESTIFLDEVTKTEANATITMHQVRSGPNDPSIVALIDFLAQMRAKSVPHELVFVDDSQLAIHVAEGRVAHSGLRVGLPKLDERLQIQTSGSVGMLDKSLVLEIEVPIPLEQLARRETIQSLGVPVMKVPVTGTLEKPVVDWKAMRGDSSALLSLMRERLQNEAPGTASALGVLEGLAEGQADQAITAAASLIQQLQERRKQKQADQMGKSPEDTTNSAPKRPLRDTLKNLRPGNKSGANTK